MAAGEGKRMNSIIPKVLHRFKEVPMLVRVIEAARQLSPQNILIITGKYYDFIDSVLRQYTTIDDIIYVDQVRPLGTGDAIRSCLYYYEGEANVLILNGDMPLITADILRRFIADSDTIGKDVYTGSILCAWFENPTGYGRIVTSIDGGGNIQRIVEEKDCSTEEREIKIVNAGIYLFPSDVLREYIPKIGNQNTQKEYYLTDIVELVSGGSGGYVRAFVIPEADNKYISGANTQAELAALELL